MMIETTNLTKEFGDVRAVDGMDLTVEKESIHGFVGPNGAGKTTAMQLIVGLLSPTEGEAYIDGEAAGTIAAKEKIGYSPQEPAFHESMTAKRYLVYMGKTAGMGSRANDRADELLEWLDLADAADQTISGFSGGMRRRLSLAQAMIHEPELLLLDEPTAELDPSGRRIIIESLEELTEEGITVFVSSHVLAELEQFIDTVTILKDGQLVETNDVSAIQSEYGGQAFSLGTSDDERVVSLLDGREWITEVRIEDDAIMVATDQPDEFKSELQSLLAEEGILLEGLTEEGSLEEAFADIMAGGEAE